jgi:hypothetical protein
VGRTHRHGSRARPALLPLVAVAALLAAGCTVGPVNFGTLPLSGTWIMGANVTGCAPAAGEITVEMDFHTVEPVWVKVEPAVVSPRTENLPVVSWARDGRRWTFVTAPVHAGDCVHFRMTSGCACCGPCPEPGEYAFDYRIRQA